MKAAFLAVSILAVALGASSVYFYRQAGVERERADAASARVAELQASSGRMRDRLKDIVTASDPFRAPAPAANEASPAQTTSPAADKPATPQPGAFGQALAGMVRDPAMKNIIQSAQRMIYGDLFTELKLSPEQTDQFMQLLADQQAAALENVRKHRGDPAGFAAATQQSKAETDAAMMNLLGPRRFPQYERYQQSLPERGQIMGLNQQLAAINAPLAEDQKKNLLTAMMQEKSAVPPPGGWTEDPMGLRNPANAEWQADYDRRVRQRAERILTAEQLKQYDNLQALQASVRSMIGQMAPAQPKP